LSVDRDLPRDGAGDDEARPDPWNWRDPAKPGYDPANRATVEWLLQGAHDASAWRQALSNTLADPRCRHVCIFGWEGIRGHDSVLRGITKFLQAGRERWNNNSAELAVIPLRRLEAGLQGE
jgi:hypothetical protein